MIGIHDNPFAIFIGGAIWFICLKYFLYLFPFPGIKRIFKGVDFIESNLNANNGYPLVMGNHCYGVYDKRKAKVILQPKYDSIRWVIPSKVVAGTLNGKEYFFDKNGKKLSNIPQSYYNR